MAFSSQFGLKSCIYSCNFRSKNDQKKTKNEQKWSFFDLFLTKKEQKISSIDLAKEIFSNNSVAILLNYKKLDAKGMSSLRKTLKSKNSKILLIYISVKVRLPFNM